MIGGKMMNNNKILVIALIATSIISFSAGSVYGMSHINYDDPDWECKKTIGMWELAKQDFPHFVNDTKWLADKKCGFDVSELID